MIQDIITSQFHSREYNFVELFQQNLAPEASQALKFASLQGAKRHKRQSVVRNETNGFNYVTTGPGGGSSKVEGGIPMYSHGSGILRVPTDYLVEIRLFACDLGEERQIYMDAMETLEDCALSNVARAKAANP
jgi:hypothetical protein